MKNPGVDMPVGIVGCISFVTIIYTLMALCLVMMVPYTDIDISASFATAFKQVGYPWGQVGKHWPPASRRWDVMGFANEDLQEQGARV